MKGLRSRVAYSLFGTRRGRATHSKGDHKGERGTESNGILPGERREVPMPRGGFKDWGGGSSSSPSVPLRPLPVALSLQAPHT